MGGPINLNFSQNDPLIAWLLEPENPSVRYFTLTRLLGQPLTSEIVQTTRQSILQRGAAPLILARQDPAGWWDNPEFIGKPAYVSTVWQLMFLGELAATADHPPIRRACELLLQKIQSEDGGFLAEGSIYHKFEPSDMLCYDGMITGSLLRLGYTQADPRIAKSVQFLNHATGELLGRCRFNANQPCAWGIIKGLRALAEIPLDQRSRETSQAIDAAAQYILDGNLSKAEYPIKPKGKISDHWFKFGFPRNYQSDILEASSTLASLGYANDRRLQAALSFIKEKQKPDNTWNLEETISKMPVQLEKRGQPSKFITLTALYTLK